MADQWYLLSPLGVRPGRVGAAAAAAVIAVLSVVQLGSMFSGKHRQLGVDEEQVNSIVLVGEGAGTVALWVLRPPLCQSPV